MLDDTQDNTQDNSMILVNRQTNSVMSKYMTRVFIDAE